MSDEACEHQFRHTGVVYEICRQLPGSSAKRRLYFDHYACEKCLEQRIEQLMARDNTYTDLLFNARAIPAALAEERSRIRRERGW